jgi:hypothetical protein
MGKTAKNEQIKLKATFYNNIAAGSAVGGIFIPLIVLYQNMPVARLFSPLLTVPWHWQFSVQDLQFFIASLVALCLAIIFRHHANRTASQLED